VALRGLHLLGCTAECGGTRAWTRRPLLCRGLTAQAAATFDPQSILGGPLRDEGKIGAWGTPAEGPVVVGAGGKGQPP
jgi:hypothetical protein